jgi:Winged helix-turn-helix DNA-binding
MLKISCVILCVNYLVFIIMTMEAPGGPGGQSGSWTILTGHGHVLAEIARNPYARLRDISPVVGLTERTVQAIVTDLEAAGYLTRARAGRRTRYNVDRDRPFRHYAQKGLRIGPFLDLLAKADLPAPAAPPRQS